MIIRLRSVNELFAKITLQALRRMAAQNPDQIPLVWIHDYHLMLAANTIRQVRENALLILRSLTNIFQLGFLHS